MAGRWIGDRLEVGTDQQGVLRRLGADRLAGQTQPEFDRSTVATLVAMLPPCARSLDLGCGYGRIALPLARAGNRVEGLDLVADMIEEAPPASRARGRPAGSHRRIDDSTAVPFG
ncbi:MAG TPA: methyltransferase domain-containing protein, partial [Gaiellales bacterium]|nr:methyltransferase domain-containing protein [Gaiellales bacterium]